MSFRSRSGHNWASRLKAPPPTLGHDAALFGRRISTGPVNIRLSREAGYRHPRAELIHLNHPLTQFAVSEMNATKLSNNAAFALRISTSRLPPGLYGFLISLIHSSATPFWHGLRKLVRLVWMPKLAKVSTTSPLKFAARSEIR